MSKSDALPQGPTTTTVKTTHTLTNDPPPLSPIATGSNGVPLSRWAPQRATTGPSGGFLSTRGAPKASNPIPIPVSATHPLQQPSTLGATPTDGTVRRHWPFMANPPPLPSSSLPSSQANSGSSTSSDNQEIDVFQALWELPKALEDRPMDLLEALKTLPKASPEERKLIPTPQASAPEVPNDQAMSFEEAIQLEPPKTLQPALQRERLFEAVRRGPTEPFDRLLADVPEPQELATYFPAPAPDRFIEDTWTPAQRHLPTYRMRLQTYLRHCREIALNHRWVRDELRQRTDVNALFSRELQGLCDLLRTTSELRLAHNADLITQAIRLALKQPAPEQALAEQPFTSLQAMRGKCAILAHDLKGDATLKSFDSALDTALAMQNHAAEKLCAGLIANPAPPPGSTRAQWSERVMAFKSLWRMALARQVTASPHERVGHKSSAAHRKQIHAYFLALHRILTNTGGSSFDIAILKRLSALAEGLSKKKSGQTYAKAHDSDDE